MLSLLLCLAFAFDDQPVGLAGSWEMVAIERFGKRLNYIRDAEASLNNPTITDQEITVPIYLDPNTVLTAYIDMRYRLRQDGETQLIDLTNESEKEVSSIMKGIYKIEGDVLTICLYPHGKARPQEFATSPGSDRQLVIMRRKGPVAAEERKNQ